MNSKNLIGLCATLYIGLTMIACSKDDKQNENNGEKNIFSQIVGYFTEQKFHAEDYIEIMFRNYTGRTYGYSVWRADRPVRFDQTSGESTPIYWHAKDTKPVTLHVVWFYMYDENKYRESIDYDEHTNPESPPGAVWCEATVPVEQPYPSDPDKLILDFFPDGSVKANVSAISDGPEENKPAPKYDKTKTIPNGKLCLNEIKNPMFGIPKKTPIN